MEQWVKSRTPNIPIFQPCNIPLSSSCGSGFPAAIRHSGRREATIRNPEKTILYWIPDLDFVSSGMTFGAVSGLFQQPAAKVTEYVILRSCRRRRISRSFALLRMTLVASISAGCQALSTECRKKDRKYEESISLLNDANFFFL
jgi:hypothetical protein